MSNLYYILLAISTLVVLFLLKFVVHLNKKKQIHYAFISLLASVFLWNASLLVYLTFKNTQYHWYYIFYELSFFLGVIGTAASIFYVGLIFAKTKIVFDWHHKLILCLPLFSVIMLLSNPLHHMFYRTFTDIPSLNERGILFTIHTAFSYLFIAIGLIYLAVFTIKNSGFFSRQSILIFIGIFVAVAFDAVSTFKIFDWPITVENIVFSFTMGCFFLAIIKFNLLNVVPIAIQTVVDLISDSYVVINEDYEIIDYNRTFINLFEGVVPFKRKDNFIKLIKKGNVGLNEKRFEEYVEAANEVQQTVNFEIQINTKNIDKYFLVEIIPIISNNQNLGTIILLKDISEHKQNLIQVSLLNEKLKELVNRDGLTRTYNRYFFDERLQQEIDRVTKQQTYGQTIYKSVDDFGLIIFDIDFFKHYNDNNGHLAGDELLQELVIVVKSALFPTDILCRYGGEEFAIICCKTSIEGVAIVAEKVRAAVEEYKFKFQESQPNRNLTISVGVSYCNSPEMDRETLIRTADQRLYKAKESGRNKVVFND